METVATLTAPIVQIRDVEHTQTVGYGATYVAQPPARLAIVGAGYADGYPRALGNRGAAALAGRRVPVVGRVSMDLAVRRRLGGAAGARARRRAGGAHRPDGHGGRGRGSRRHDQLRDPDGLEPAAAPRVSRRVTSSLILAR